jgi:hypothetical protein
MDKRPQRLAKNKTDLMPKNALCKRWDTLKHSQRATPHTPAPNSVRLNFCMAVELSDASGQYEQSIQLPWPIH